MLKLRPCCFALFAALVLVVSSASADVPPPDGLKYVSYAFKLDATSKKAGTVFVAYPYSTSDGAPTVELAELEPGKLVYLGRRSPQPTIYAVPADVYATWKKENPPKDTMNVQEELKVLQATGKLVPCDLRPQRRSTLDSSDPRETIVDTYSVSSVSDSACKLALAKPAADAAPTKTPKSGGCAGCTLGPVKNAPSRGAITLLMFGLLAWLRRKAPRAAASPR